MADVEEPQFTTLSQRIAALKQQQQHDAPIIANRPPPPPIPTSDRPPLPTRPKTTNNPPVLTYGSSVTQKPFNEPIATKSNSYPSPSVVPVNKSKSPALPPRNAPPPLPTRKVSAPALPPRKASTCTQLARRGSGDSTISQVSTVSALSLNGYGRPPSSITSIGSKDGRVLPPPLDMAKLPPLPPTRRELQEKARIEQKAKMPLVSTKSAPAVVLKQAPVIERDIPPKMPSRPSGPPQIPSRPIANAEQENAVALPPRRLPPPSTTRSVLSLGFGSKPTETPNAAPKPAPTYNRSPSPAVQELNANNFDHIVLSGKFALVDFYTPYCKYCVELDPHYQRLAEAFAFASDRLVIAKVDVNEHKSFMARYGIQGYPTIMFFDRNGDGPETYQYMRETDAMTAFLTEKTGISPSDAPKPGRVPPPINLRSKPTSSQVKVSSAAPTQSSPSSTGCLLCRDFSGPDEIASRYPRESLPRSHDNTGYLADVLCRPFSSPTDKARAIFVWLHHNIAYDTGAFFGNRVKNVTPADTIKTGLAVCGGYAGLFATIAVKAGLEAIVVTGHGKGFGYQPLKAGESCPPPNPGGHAWNAVRIDGGEWKLIDACWGSGQIGDDQTYNQNLISSYFTMSNDDFGIKHFPADKAHFFRSDGKILTWEEYLVGKIGGEALQIFRSPEDLHGISQTSFTPPQKHIQASRTSNDVMRFQFSKICTHYDFERNGPGKPYCMLLKIGGVDGRKEDLVALEFDGFWWWLDVPVRELGARGQTISLFAITSVDGKDARGMTKGEYEGKKGRCGMGFDGVAAWVLV
ncbi:hypothetical protein DSL72_004440 [Monilinia vaccinii-corymbosi]|uniref:Thioredoxin domain-containing protein n=1 Tax=Monilinia vaccinii-corymbosi TaxID=61207 RepID=A0A8A3NZA1_9HELO|nr:hypothetical protein DSL72_004440 [Monilinia vaccinii-corymbosi]